MEIFIGGSGQNKEQIVMLKCDLMSAQDACDGDLINYEEIFCVKAVNHFHRFVLRNMERFGTEEDMELFVQMLMEENSDIILIGDEIGCGIVPLEQKDRDYREIYGRIMCLLTQRAKKVTRIICGICQVIKDEKG